VTPAQAFSASIGTVAVKVSEGAGRDTAIGTARDPGIASPIASEASFAIGASKLSLLEMTAAYAAIAAGVYRVEPWGVAGPGAEPAGGGEPPREAGLWKLARAESMREVLSPEVRNGSGRAARLPIPAFANTGTSQQHRDAWFIGFVGNLVIGVWAGNDGNTPIDGVRGGSLPAEIWQLVMQEALDTDPDFQRTLPSAGVFKAHGQEPLECFSRLAALEASAVPGSKGTRQATQATPSRRRRLTLQEFERREANSSDFSDMSWPGRN
jgi:penicillin-binding protein 1A